MASADLLLRPAETSTSGLVELEAQASGLPVLLTSGGTARDHMRPGLTGLVCPSGDVLGLAGRVSELLTDPARRRVMGEAARRFAQSRSWQGSLERVYALYRSASQAGAVGASPERGCRRPGWRQPDEGRAMTLAITVIVCAHNERGCPRACNPAQTRPPDELLVINNASTDETGAVARQIPDVRVVDEPRRGPGYTHGRRCCGARSRGRPSNAPCAVTSISR